MMSSRLNWSEGPKFCVRLGRATRIPEGGTACLAPKPTRKKLRVLQTSDIIYTQVQRAANIKCISAIKPTSAHSHQTTVQFRMESEKGMLAGKWHFWSADSAVVHVPWLKTVGRQGILSVSNASVDLLEVPGRICVCGLGMVQDLGHRRLVQHPENKDSYRIFSKWLRGGRRKGGGGERDRETARERG